MIHSVQFTAILDTNVMFPVITRDILLWFAHYDLYTPKWSKHIFDEWRDVMLRKGVSESETQKRIDRVNQAFPDALVQNYESLIKFLSLPDEKDCHVLAAAIKINAHIIVTNNTKHFPTETLAMYDLKTKTADDFLTDIIDLNQDVAVEAFREMVLNKKNPELDEYEVLAMLRNNNLKQTADYLHTLI
ncbi:MAG: PIN domain-containing protein [Fermentimonas sp.]|jgi:predicted nucleic acid-binding protein